MLLVRRTDRGVPLTTASDSRIDEGAPAIVVEGLVRKFDEIRAVDDVTFQVRRGEMFGFLGPNGAGKTTTISMMCTLLHPTAGNVTVWGHDARKEPDEVRSSIGIVFQDQSVDEELTGYENMWFHARLYKVDKDVIDDRIRDLLAMVELTDRAEDQVKTYSGGMKRRLEIARGLLHHPHVLFLDEPTLGLDPQTRRHIWDYIRKLNEEEGVTIFLTTHYMDEADELCDRIAIIDKGKIVAIDTPEGLKASLGGDVVRLRMPACDEGCQEALRQVPGVSTVRPEEEGLILGVDEGASTIPRIIETIGSRDLEVESVTLKMPTLEDVFIRKTGHTLRDERVEGKDQLRAMGRRHIRRRRGGGRR
ncbi:MAG: ATP-binding cassette domain-containing protein [Thermoplasmata archaeon]|nr:MAG: ATP-binding cassette domain-containing protein [Thermoplasmata archaeon]